MNLYLYQYGHGANLPGISIGVARMAPRGIRVEERFCKGYFQVWMPLLAPSPELVTAYRGKKISYQKFAARYRQEMKAPAAKQTINLIAALSQTVRINLGCFCKDDETCHRSQLAQLIEKAAEETPQPPNPIPQYCSPPCSMPEIED